jgi:MFS superfamily sulfate permease-like transporter
MAEARADISGGDRQISLYCDERKANIALGSEFLVVIVSSINRRDFEVPLMTDEPIASHEAVSLRNRFGRLEWAGAFGDLGTLIPFVVAYISVMRLDPLGVLLGFGVCMVASGLFYKTPFPVQPMKAIGAVAATQAAQTAIITPQAVYGAALVTGIIWLVLGLTGATRWVANLISRPVAIGIILGLGLGFMLEGIKLMAAGWMLSAAALSIALLLLSNQRLPAMFVLLIGGAMIAVVREPTLISALGAIQFAPRLPSFAIADISWSDLGLGVVFLALPQVPLTLGNAIIAITDENNRLFPRRPVSERTVSISTGLMNLFGASVGGVPMCHGAGGMAGHVRFGARTGGALVILGLILIVLGLSFSSSVETIFRVVPSEILGVILFLTGAQLALGSLDFSDDQGERFTTIVTAGLSMWNIGLAFVIGLSLFHSVKRGWIRL